mmetsp:Transcript_62301/g.103603  ORF Transcript_62301/g.103603 Transcript_62301/m.103603 type:complete len:210 (-) Transcript_62301:215-844(-)
MLSRRWLPVTLTISYASIDRGFSYDLSRGHVPQRSIPCSSGLKGDAATELCASFCSAQKAENHCQFCKCRSCAYCPVNRSRKYQGGIHTPCNSSIFGDFRYRFCASFCNAERARTHCAFCKCSDCTFCLPADQAVPALTQSTLRLTDGSAKIAPLASAVTAPAHLKPWTAFNFFIFIVILWAFVVATAMGCQMWPYLSAALNSQTQQYQ